MEGLKLNYKCILNASELTFLGHVVNARGLLSPKSAAGALQGTPAPTGLKSLRCLLGLLVYYSRFIPCFAELPVLMTELRKEGKAPEQAYTHKAAASVPIVVAQDACPSREDGGCLLGLSVC